MKFLMNSLLTSVLAEIASSVLPSGALAAAVEMLSETVTVAARLSTDKVMGTSSVAPAATCAPERVATEKPGAEAMMEYPPGATSDAENFPSASLVTERDGPPELLLNSTVALGIGLPVWSTT